MNKKLVIPEGVTMLEDGMVELDDMEEITLPKSLKTVGKWVFRSCSDLKRINLNGNENFAVMHSGLIELSTRKLIKFFGNSSEEAENCLKHCHIIGAAAFFGANENIEKITIPVNITEIEEETFCACKNLKEVVLAAGISTISRATFAACKKIEKLMLPDGLKRICENAFGQCYNLKKIVIPDSVEVLERNCFGYIEYPVIVCCKEGSVVHMYAQDNNIKFELI